jgi:hypothetical protein
VAREWGHLARTNNDQTEIQWETWACAAINSYYPVNWDRMSCYGSGTTGTNVYNTIWWCQDYDNWVSTFLCGTSIHLWLVVLKTTLYTVKITMILEI